MPVQDDERERELVRMFNLEWDPSHQRAGVDALLHVNIDGVPIAFEVEVKSSTGETVATARDVGLDHIEKWRRKLFVIGFYTKEARRPELLRCLCLTPIDMEPWIAEIEEKTLVDFELARLTPSRLTMPDLFKICGKKESYTIEDAKRLHKRQWTADDYLAALDMGLSNELRISPLKMLEILKLRALYIGERGATLNNPHVPKKFLERFNGTSRVVTGPNWALGVRQIAVEFARENPMHRALIR